EKAGFIVGLSHDDGATWQSKLHFCDITGPLACPANAPTTQYCTAGTTGWPVQRATLGCDSADAGGDAAPPPSGSFEAGGGAICSYGAAKAAPYGGFVASLGALAALVRRLRRRAR